MRDIRGAFDYTLTPLRARVMRERAERERKDIMTNSAARAICGGKA